MKKILIIALSVFALSVQADSFKSAIKAAETGYKANLAVNMAWRDTGKMIKQAKKLYAAGKTDAAMALAHKAHTQTVNATKQTALAKNAGPLF